MKIYCDDGGGKKKNRRLWQRGGGETRKSIEGIEREKKGERICPAGSKHRVMGVEA